MIFVPANPDLANILGDVDFDFEIFHLFDLLDSKLLDFLISRFLDLAIQHTADRPGDGRAGGRAC